MIRWLKHEFWKLVFWSRKLVSWIEIRRYKRYKAGHVFNIRVNDLAFTMSFEDFPITAPIVERIHGVREPETVAIIRTLLRGGENVLEIGACYGYFTMNMAYSIGATGRLVSIEGAPNNYRVTKNNLTRNNVTNVELHNVFLDSTHQTAEFKVNDYDPYGAIARLDKKSEEKGLIHVPCVRISDFLKKINFQPAYIFMDIEGFEVDVLEDLTSTGYIRKQKPTIVFEIHEQFYKQDKGLTYLIKIFESHSYITRRIAGNLLCFPQILQKDDTAREVS